MLRAADRRLGEVRCGMPDAAGLVIATDQTDARAYARHLHELTGEQPVVVLFDDDGAAARIEEFTSSVHADLRRVCGGSAAGPRFRSPR